MPQGGRSWSWLLRLVGALAVSGAVITFSGNCALPQIKPDTTLGAESSSVRGNVEIKGLESDRIEGGARRGANLFHSFQEFNIDDARGAYFTKPVGVKNILSRVTGNDRSEILGTLGVLGQADLFMINPNGIIFGPNASLDVEGSFVGTTASAVGLANGDIFSTDLTESLPSQLLNINPNAFFFNQIAAQPITVNSRGEIGLNDDNEPLYEGLKVPNSQSLLLIGGNVSLDTGILEAPGGRVELGGVAGTGTVALNRRGSNLSLSFPRETGRADVSLTDKSAIDVTAGSGGGITVQTQNLDIRESSLLAGIGSGLGSAGSQAGDITLNATGAIKITNGLVFNGVEPKAVGKGRDITIKARSLSLTDGAKLIASTFGEGDAGSITIRANDSVSLVGEDTAVFSSVSSPSAVGNSRGIELQARPLSLTDGAKLIASTFGEGDDGSIIIRVNGDPGNFSDFNGGAGNLSDFNFGAGNLSESNATTGIFSTVESQAKGNAGNIEIQSPFLSLTSGAEVQSLTRGGGNAGDIRVHASKAVNLSGVAPQFHLKAKNEVNDFDLRDSRLVGGFSSGLITATEEGARGEGGNIEITTSALHLSDGAVLSARTRSNFRSGDITVKTNTLKATNGGQLLTSAFGRGNAGNITVNAADSVNVSGSDSTFSTRLKKYGLEIVDQDGPVSGLFARTQDVGAAGDLTITTGQLLIQDGAEVSVSGRVGQAGNLTTTANSILLNQGKLTAVTGAGEGGNIKVGVADVLVPDLLLMRNNSEISAEALGKANGGNIDIDTDLSVALENSDITANASEGWGGEVRINTQGDFRSPDSQVTASSELGAEFSGTVELNTPVDPSQGIVALPEGMVDPAGLIAQGCSAREGATAQRLSQFVVTGRGGVPADPYEALSSDAVLTNWAEPESRSSQVKAYSQAAEPTSDNSVTTKASPEMTEAQGWVKTPDGQVMLVAQAPTATPHSSGLAQPSCPTSHLTY